MRWSVGAFGVKDMFTLVNLTGGALGLAFAVQGHIAWAGFAILAGYLLGDVPDGAVARATKTGNRFGAEFDAATDHVAQAIAPAVLVYAANRAVGHGRVGFVLMLLLIATACLRQARFATARFDFPLCYCGLPRTISGVVAAGIPNSVLLFERGGAGYWIGTVVIALVAVLHLVPIPYMTHKGRRMQGYVRVLILLNLLLPFIVFFAARPYTFDVLVLFGVGYALLGWLPVHPDERAAFGVERRRWAAEVATSK